MFPVTACVPCGKFFRPESPAPATSARFNEPRQSDPRPPARRRCALDHPAVPQAGGGVKVLSLIGGLDPAFGGPSVPSVDSIIAAQRAGIDTTVAFPVDPARPEAAAPAIARLTGEAVAVETFPLASRPAVLARRWGISFALRSWLRAHRRDYDIIHCHGAWVMPSYLALRYAGRRREPRIVLSPHEGLTEFDIRQTPSRCLARFKRRLRERYLRRLDLIVTASRFEAADSMPLEMMRGNRLAVIYHPVYDDRRHRARPRIAMVTTEGLRLGFIGRLEPEKNLDLVLRALPRVGPNVSLTVAGEGGEDTRLRRLAADIGVADRVTWLGFVTGAAKEDFFRHIDLLVMPSDYECFGMSGGEALSAGVPLLVSRVTGIGEIVEAGGGGAIITRDPADIAAAIEKLLHNPKRLAQYSQHAAAAAEAALSFSAHGAALRRHYERLLAPSEAIPDRT